MTETTTATTTPVTDSTAASAWTAFFAAAVHSPLTVGAIAPSSDRLARRLAEVVPDNGDPTVVELGPGTGPVTTAIGHKLWGRGRHLALDTSADMLAYLRTRHPEVIAYHTDAADLLDVLAHHRLDAADVIISGLPWTLFRAEVQAGLLDRITTGLHPGGVFTTFTYLNAQPLPPARRFRRLLHQHFGEVLPTQTIWANFPPALTYVCRYPAPPTAGMGA